MGSAKDRKNRWAIAPPPSAESSAVSGEFQFEPVPAPLRRERNPLQSDRIPIPQETSSGVTLKPPVEAVSAADDEEELRESQRVTEVPLTMPDFSGLDRDADTIPAPPNLDLDIEE